MTSRPPCSSIQSNTSPATYHAKTGEVFSIDLSFAWLSYLIIGFKCSALFISNSFFTMTIVKPAIPRFFWAPANIKSNSLTSKGLVHNVEDISQTSGVSI